MFDIGFAELLIIGVVALLVIGPERLPGAVRTASVWLNRFRRSFNQIKQEVQQELHNDAVMRELRESGDTLRRETEALQKEFSQPMTLDSPAPAERRQPDAAADVTEPHGSAGSDAIESDTADSPDADRDKSHTP
jgi:sec-independent protein translocase protein TatB